MPSPDRKVSFDSTAQVNSLRVDSAGSLIPVSDSLSAHARTVRTSPLGQRVSPDRSPSRSSSPSSSNMVDRVGRIGYSERVASVRIGAKVDSDPTILPDSDSNSTSPDVMRRLSQLQEAIGNSIKRTTTHVTTAVTRRRSESPNPMSSVLPNSRNESPNPRNTSPKYRVTYELPDYSEIYSDAESETARRDAEMRATAAANGERTPSPPRTVHAGPVNKARQVPATQKNGSYLSNDDDERNGIFTPVRVEQQGSQRFKALQSAAVHASLTKSKMVFSPFRSQLSKQSAASQRPSATPSYRSCSY